MIDQVTVVVWWEVRLHCWQHRYVRYDVCLGEVVPGGLGSRSRNPQSVVLGLVSAGDVLALANPEQGERQRFTYRLPQLSRSGFSLLPPIPSLCHSAGQ